MITKFDIHVLMIAAGKKPFANSAILKHISHKPLCREQYTDEEFDNLQHLSKKRRERTKKEYNYRASIPNEEVPENLIETCKACKKETYIIFVVLYNC